MANAPSLALQNLRSAAFIRIAKSAYVARVDRDIAPETGANPPGPVRASSAAEEDTMIDGLKLTMTGGELRALLDEQVRRHEERADWWTRDRSRTDDAAERPRLPDHISRNEAERHGWRADVLRFMRDHVEVRETYLLGAADLELGELLPPKPGWLAQDEYEERIRPAATLGDLSKTLDRMVGAAYGMLGACDGASGRQDAAGRLDERDAFRTTHLDLADGPGVVVVERKPQPAVD